MSGNNYYDSRITYEKSWLARLKYVHQNPVHHGVVQSADLYEWCSAAWFAREGGNAIVKTVNSFKIDQVKVYDDYMECDGSTALSKMQTKDMECGGLDTALKQGGSTPDAPARQSSKSGVEPEYCKAPAAQSKSGVELLRKPSAHRTPRLRRHFKAVSSHRTPDYGTISLQGLLCPNRIAA